MNPDASGAPWIGVDLGGTKIAGIVLGPDGDVLADRRVATPQGDYGATLEAIAGLVAELEAAIGRSASVGLATPGAIAPGTGHLKNCNATWLNGRPLREDVEAALARSVRLANDADCLALSEAADGAAVGADVVFGAILGTGVGGGLVAGGRLLRGPNAITGEWGHNPLPWADAYDRPGQPCYCGRRGCVETYLSGDALRREMLARTGHDHSAEAVAALAAGGHAAAVAAVEGYALRLAKGLASVVNVIDPDVVVLGGGLSRIDALYPRVRALWGRWIFSDAVRTRLVPAQHGAASGVRGAARLWG